MSRARILLLSVLLIEILSTAASAIPVAYIQSMKELAYAIGYLMMVILGILWITSEGANERLEAKKGMLYIIIALLVIASYCSIMQTVYCKAATDSMAAGGLPFTCDMASIGCP
jgi:hypothetical protein